MLNQNYTDSGIPHRFSQNQNGSSAGLIISEATQILPEGQGYISTPGIHSAEQTEGWKCVTKAVYVAGG
jgi:2,4-dienoyl-CoA reductase-like NADH-dependent reductase (Old Yellow Enzyme family)